VRGSPRGRPGDPIGACSDGEPSWGTPAGHRAGAPPSPGPPDGRRHAGRRAGHRGGSGARSRLGPGPRRPRRDRPPPAAVPERRGQPPPPRPRTAPSGPEARPQRQEPPTRSVQGRANLGQKAPDGEPLLGRPSGSTRHLPVQIGALIGSGHASGRSRRGVPQDQVTDSPGRDGKRAPREAAGGGHGRDALLAAHCFELTEVNGSVWTRQLSLPPPHPRERPRRSGAAHLRAARSSRPTRHLPRALGASLPEAGGRTRVAQEGQD